MIRAKACGLLSFALIFSCNTIFAKTVTINCPTVKTTLTRGYTTTENGFEWRSWQAQPSIEVSTAMDKDYFAELSQSYKGISLRCVGGIKNQNYGFFTHSPKITSCKLDPKNNKGFICEVSE